MDGRLELLSDDRGACHMVNIATLNGQVHLYVVHFVCEPVVVHMIEGGTETEVGVDGAVEGEVDVETRGDEEPAVVGGVEVEAAGEGEGDMEVAVDVEHVGVEVGEAPTDKGEGEVEVEHDDQPAEVGGASENEGQVEVEHDEVSYLKTKKETKAGVLGAEEG